MYDFLGSKIFEPMFLLFYEIESLKGMMGLGVSLSGCLHTRKIITKNIKMLE